MTMPATDPPPEDPRPVDVRVVNDQPWEVATDVLVVPIVVDPAFEGPLDELDRRSGGELRALAAFGELSGKRYATSLAATGELPANRLVTVGIGDPAGLDRETVQRIGATAERRLGGRAVDRLAIWITPLVDASGESPETVAELVARGVVEGSYDPATIYRETVETSPPDARPS